MRDFETIADRVEIEALRGEFTDAVMMRDYDRVASCRRRTRARSGSTVTPRPVVRTSRSSCAPATTGRV